MPVQAMASSRFESGRERFLQHLHGSEIVGPGASEFMTYWRRIEVEAQASEDLGQLDTWVKEIAKDKDRLMELRARHQQAASSHMGEIDSLGLLARILALLDEIEGQLRRRHHHVRNELGLWVFLAGMGRKSKPKPNQASTKKGKEKKDDDIEQHLLEQQKKKPESSGKKLDR